MLCMRSAIDRTGSVDCHQPETNELMSNGANFAWSKVKENLV